MLINAVGLAAPTGQVASTQNFWRPSAHSPREKPGEAICRPGQSVHLLNDYYSSYSATQYLGGDVTIFVKGGESATRRIFSNREVHLLNNVRPPYIKSLLIHKFWFRHIQQMYAEAGDWIAESVGIHASYLPRFIFAIDNVSHAGYIYFSGQIGFFVFLVVIEVAVDKDFGSAHHFAPTISVTPSATRVAPSIPATSHREISRKVSCLRLIGSQK
jgi:hypothetical protein